MTNGVIIHSAFEDHSIDDNGLFFPQYTEKFPWRFIFFEGSDTSFNFSENRDRCNYSYYLKQSLNEWQLGGAGHHINIYNVRYSLQHKVASESAKREQASAQVGDTKSEPATRRAKQGSQPMHIGESDNRDDEWELAFGTYFDDFNNWPKESKSSPDWEISFNKVYDQSEQCILFIVGPPGKHLLSSPLLQDVNVDWTCVPRHRKELRIGTQGRGREAEWSHFWNIGLL